MMRKDDRERDKLDADTMLRAAEIEAKYNTQVNTANIQALMQRDREFLKQAMAPAPQPAPMPMPAPEPAPMPMPEGPMPPEGMM